MRVVSLLGLAVLAISLFGCGDSGPSAAEKREAAERKEKAVERKEEAAAEAKASECRSQLGDFLESLEELDARLQVGLNYDDYFNEVGNVQVAYNRIPINQLSQECLSQVGLPSESAFRSYSEAAEDWEECFENLTCEGEDPELQAKWATAERQEARAQRGLVAMRIP
jgi:hypothetical protein